MTQNALRVEAMEVSLPLPDFDKLGFRTQVDPPPLSQIQIISCLLLLAIPLALSVSLVSSSTISVEHMIPFSLSPLLYDCSAPFVSGGSSITVS
jgi:hypothetical protein